MRPHRSLSSTSRWAPVERRLESLLAVSDRFIAEQGLAHEAKVDQSLAAVRDVLVRYGVDVDDRDQLLAVSVGTFLVALHASAAAAYGRLPHPDHLLAVGFVVDEAGAAVARIVPDRRREWTLTFDDRPFTLNAERKGSRFTRAATVRVWREAFCVLARQQRIPRLERISVVVQPVFRNAKSMQDVAGCVPAAKAAVDGIADAGVVPADGPAHVIEQTFRAPVVDRERRSDALVVTVVDEGPAR